MKRPVFVWAASFALGAVLGNLTGISTFLFTIILLFLFLFFICFLYPKLFIRIIKDLTKSNEDKKKSIQKIVKEVFQNNGQLEKHKYTVKLIYYICGILFFLGIIFMKREKAAIEYYDSLCGQEITLSGIVADYNSKSDSYLLKAGDTKVEVKKLYFDLPTELTGSALIGMRIECSGISEQFKKATNPGAYDEKEYKNSEGIYLKLKSAKVHKISKPFFMISGNLRLIRDKLTDVYLTMLGNEDGGLASAMVLGDKSVLDSEIKDLYQRNGIAHLIAISGLHIAMIGGVFYTFIRKKTGSFIIGGSIGITFICLYGMMTGLSGSTKRAVIMLIVLIGAEITGRRYDILSSIALALLIMLIDNPLMIFQVGFRLSFGAVLGISLIYPCLKDSMDLRPLTKDSKCLKARIFLRKLLDGVLVSISVQTILTPIMLYHYYEIPSYSIILNIIVVPLMSIVLFCLIILGLGGLFFPSVFVVFKYPCHFLFLIYKLLCCVNESIPGHMITTGRPPVLWIVIYYVILAVGVYLMQREKGLVDFKSLFVVHDRKLPVLGNEKFISVAFFYMFLLATFIWFVLPCSNMFCMFDVGQGDGMLIRTMHHHFITIDGGSSSVKNVGEYVLEKGYKFYGCGSIDYAVVTHSDSDHYSGIEEILNAGEIKINNLVLPEIADPDEEYENLVALAEQRGGRVIYMKRGDEIQIDGVRFVALSPQGTESRSKNESVIGEDVGLIAEQSADAVSDDKNEQSLVLLCMMEEEKILLMADAGFEAEKEILEYVSNNKELTEDIDILKVGHHGSNYSSSMEFLKTFSPKLALISAGAHNRYGHPGKETIKRLDELGIPHLCTIDCGQIGLKWKEEKCSVRCENN